MYAGDEVYGDEVTSALEDGPVWCADCGTKLRLEDSDLGLCRDCYDELGEAGA